eukprot:4506877-Amphidinium_carterae.1
MSCNILMRVWSCQMSLRSATSIGKATRGKRVDIYVSSVASGPAGGSSGASWFSSDSRIAICS